MRRALVGPAAVSIPEQLLARHTCKKKDPRKMERKTLHANHQCPRIRQNALSGEEMGTRKGHSKMSDQKKLQRINSKARAAGHQASRTPDTNQQRTSQLRRWKKCLHQALALASHNTRRKRVKIGTPSCLINAGRLETLRKRCGKEKQHLLNRHPCRLPRTKFDGATPEPLSFVLEAEMGHERHQQT